MSPKHLLIVDDDPDDTALFQIALSEFDPSIQISVMHDGTSLIKSLEKGLIPDVIIIDLNLPYVSGMECLHQIRMASDYDKVQVYILSGHNRQSTIQFCLRNGATNYFMKPITDVDYKRIVSEIISTAPFENEV